MLCSAEHAARCWKYGMLFDRRACHAEEIQIDSWLSSRFVQMAYFSVPKVKFLRSVAPSFHAVFVCVYIIYNLYETADLARSQPLARHSANSSSTNIVIEDQEITFGSCEVGSTGMVWSLYQSSPICFLNFN